MTNMSKTSQFTNNEEEKLDLTCHQERPNKIWFLILDWVMLVGMLGLGAFIMVDGIISVA